MPQTGSRVPVIYWPSLKIDPEKLFLETIAVQVLIFEQPFPLPSLSLDQYLQHVQLK